jgi:type VI secretion system secreted protein Hcp
MATVDYFLKIDPIKGESQDHKHKNEIDIISWSWHATNSGHGMTGAGSGAGKVSAGDLSFTHFVDAASADLFLSCCNGKHFNKALLTCRKAGEKPLEFLKIHLEQVFISSVQNGGSQGDVRPIESISLNYAKIKFEYTEQNKDGSAGTSTPKGYSVSTNEPWN